MKKSPKQIALQLIIHVLSDEVDLNKKLFQWKETQNLPTPDKAAVIKAYDEIWNELMDKLELQKEVDNWPEIDMLKVKVYDARTGKEI